MGPHSEAPYKFSYLSLAESFARIVCVSADKFTHAVRSFIAGLKLKIVALQGSITSIVNV